MRQSLEVVTFFVVCAWLVGCVSSSACPEGWVANATGDCVPVSDGDSDAYDGLVDREIVGPSADTDETAGDDDRPLDNGEADCWILEDCEIGEICHFIFSDGGRCAPSCEKKIDCLSFGNNYYCDQQQQCHPGEEPSSCLDTSDCPYSKLCHTAPGVCENSCASEEDTWCRDRFGAGYYCSGAGTCRKGTPQTQCTMDDDCQNPKVCHENFEGGICDEPCLDTSDCGDENSGYYCNYSQRCVPEHSKENCEENDDCIIGKICHLQVDGGTCMSPCDELSDCTSLGHFPPLFCNTTNQCIPERPEAGCSEDAHCMVNTICHERVENGLGVCMPSCESHQDCADMLNLQGYTCNALGQCIPPVNPDGDEDEDGDTEIHETTGSGCTPVYNGGTYRIDLANTVTTFRITANGEAWSSEDRPMAVVLTDRKTGVRFDAIEDIFDGNGIEPISLLAGNYRIWVKNYWGQRIQLYDDYIIEGEQTIDLDVPFVRLSMQVTKNGENFPVLDADYQGYLYMKDNLTYQRQSLGKVGFPENAENRFVEDVFATNYTLVFDGYLDNSPDSRQVYTVRSNLAVAHETTYAVSLALDLPTVEIQGEVLINGETPGDDLASRGELWLINPLTSDRFRFWSLGASGEVTVNREVVSDHYRVGYAPPGNEGSSYLWLESETMDWLTDRSVEIDIPRYTWTGEVVSWGESLPDHENLDRGFIYAVDSSTNEKTKIIALGLSGETTFETVLGPGVYSLYFEGALIDDAFFVGRSYPRTDHKLIFEQGVEITGDISRNIDLPIVELPTTIKYNGDVLTADLADSNEYVTMRRDGSYDDVPIIHLGTYTESPFNTLLFTGTYEANYTGDDLMCERYQTTTLAEDVIVDTETTELDFNIRQHAIEFSFFDETGETTLAQILEEGPFDSTELHIIDNTQRYKEMATSVYADNRFSFCRPPGNYTFILRLNAGEYYEEHPVLKNHELAENLDADINLPFLTMSFEVLLNGESVPDDGSESGEFGRGDIILRGRDKEFYRMLDLDIGASGPVDGENRLSVQTLPPETNNANPANYYPVYDVYFSTGSSDVFPIPQWVHMGCIEIVD